MRKLICLTSCAVIGLLVVLHSSDAGNGKKAVQPTKRWAGKKGEDALANLAPKAGYLTDQKAFEELWGNWKLGEKAPAIDFAKQIVFVQLAKGGPNVPNSKYSLDDKGDLTVLSISTLIGGPGFGYSVDVLDREGIKTYQGKPIEAPKEKK